MTNDNSSPSTGPRAPKTASAKSVDRLIAWCAGIFVISAAGFIALAIYSVQNGRLSLYFQVAGAVYLLFCVSFLIVISVALIQGHLARAREIEAPKMELFDLEERR